MDRTAAQVLRVLGIVAISLVIILAALIFAIASMCGMWSSTSTADQAAKLYIGIGCPAIFIGGIFLIAKMAKGIARSRRKARTVVALPAEAAPIEERDYTRETEPLLHLRVAVTARILLSAAMVTYHQVQPGAYGHQYLFAGVLGFLIYEAPNGWVLWRIREQLERFAVSLAVAYPGVGLLWTMWNFTVYLRYLRSSHNPQMLVTWLLPAAAEIAVVVIGWRARMAMPRKEDDDSTLAAAFGVALIYTFIAFGLTNIFYRMRPF